ncbi:MAG: glycerophosphodiester phosphodiesterase [Sphingobacteriales bacterium]|nr:glycerophosphodiester phosphodiesterase [Sphingobacteriales bacterium]
MIKYLIPVLLVMVLSCSGSKKTQKAGMETARPPYTEGVFDKQGHRGCRGLMPENTIPAMIHALGMGVTTLEMDVVFTKDKKMILSHEPFFNHEISTKPDGSPVMAKEERSLNIYQMNYAEVQRYDVGLKPHPRFPRQEKMKAVKPLLADVFEAVKQYMMMARRPFPYYNIETKTQPLTDTIYHPGPAEFVDSLMALIREKQLEDHVIIQSFDFRTLQYLHLHYPSVKTAMLIEDYDKRTLEEQLKALAFTPSIYSPGYQLVNESLLKKCHDLNMKVIPWTVNEKATIDALKKIGVDGIITDYPDLFN